LKHRQRSRSPGMSSDRVRHDFKVNILWTQLHSSWPRLVRTQC